MEKDTLVLTAAERDRLVVIRQLSEGRLLVREAVEKLKIGKRQVLRLLARWKEDGDGGLISRQFGRSPTNRIDGATRERIETLLRGEYAGFGPTFAAEKLRERDNIKISKETVRSILMEMGEHRAKERSDAPSHETRERRHRFGELVQIDGSPHKWFEWRGKRCTLIVFIDDATSMITAAFFAPTETGAAYAAALRAYILRYGLPAALYSDRTGIFSVNAKNPVSGDGKTEFNRISDRLGIKHILAMTPQAKGRVERSNRTLQDRLIKEMRLAGINDIDAANAWVGEFLEKRWKERFTVVPSSEEDAHRPWTKTERELDIAFAKHLERDLVNHKFQYDGKEWRIDVKSTNIALKSVRVLLRVFQDGHMEVEYNKRIIPHKLVRKVANPPPEADAKNLNDVVDRVLEEQREAVHSSADTALAA
jgi:transposase